MVAGRGQDAPSWPGIEKATEGSEGGEGNLGAAKPNGVLVSKVYPSETGQLSSGRTAAQLEGSPAGLGEAFSSPSLPAALLPCSLAGRRAFLGGSLPPHSLLAQLTLGPGV